MSSVLFFLTAAVVVTALGAWLDVRTGHIPNWLTMGTIALAPLLHGATELARGGTVRAALIALVFSVGGAAVCAVFPAGLHARDAIGGGDVKLFAAVGALCHPLLALRAELYSFAFGGVYALAVACGRQRLRGVLANVATLVTSGRGSSREASAPAPTGMIAVRFGPAIFAGTVASIWLESGR
jgi:prepilin peptidase CpaA